MNTVGSQYYPDMTLADYKLALNMLPDIQREMGFNIGCNNYDVIFFGGEPLLRIDNILDINDYKASINKNASTSVITNATLLTPEIYDTLLKKNINLSISYDGPFSNQRDVEGHIPSDYVVDLMRSKNPKCMISPSNVESLYRNFSFFKRNGIRYPSFSLVRDNIWDRDSLKEFDRQLKLVCDYILGEYEECGVFYIPHIFSLYLTNILLSVIRGKRKYNCFAGTSGVAIFGNGDIYPCARFGSSRKLKLGNYKQNLLNRDVIKFLCDNTSTPDNRFCKTCELFTVCTMGCLYSQLSFGQWIENKPVSCICDAYKIIYKYSLFLYDKLKNENLLSYLLKV